MNILITGGKSGIAKRVIEKLGTKYTIYITVHTEKQCELLEKTYQNQDFIHCLKLDVTNLEDRKKVESLNIDVLICNAAIGVGGSTFELPISLMRDNFEVNVFSNLELVQAVFQKMIQKGTGRIIFISSLAGYMPIPFLGSYCASKASINMISGTMRLEAKLLPQKIDIITVLPGLYYTGFNQLMTEDKYSRMDIDTYFKTSLELLKKYETSVFHLLESKNLDRIASKIVHAATSNRPKSIYRSRPSQIIAAKLYQLFFT